MSSPTTIRILETDKNRKGDLFNRLMVDLFVALGYEQPRLNIYKPGRELDLSTNHRLENRRAVAECKATTEAIGGGDLNKFVGVLDADREDERPVTGYFISLHGFTETAILQESKRRTKIIMLDGQQVVDELVEGRIVIPWDKATELAGRYCGPRDDLTLDTTVELLAHERGWIWAVYYLQGKLRSHFALIHSDGTPLARAVASEVISADQTCGGALHNLECLNPTPVGGTDAEVAKALDAYRHYLTNECGFIQLDGLPADSDVGSRRLRLENLFVPLHVDITLRINGEDKKLERQKIGEALTKYQRLALLAAPGGGKSTLVKRLAVAYIDSARRKEISDDLPEHDWLPLFFRCRELRDLARGSFADLLQALAEREPVRQHARVFRALVDRALLVGRVLLLVDGLDEISDPGDRAAFVCTLRSAIQAYPGTALVVTSREAGFRHVAVHLAPLCTLANLSAFDSDDITSLSVAWHTEVVGDSEKVRLDAESLATTVINNDRINRLAVNPLLLTTLLLVKRWVGTLPTRRAVLYGKAVEVLLMTWNTEGYKPIPDDQAIPQLCYVASAMLLDGMQKISRQCLASLIQEARITLPTELGYVEDTVDEFINRIEDRSSLLMMNGLDVEDGRLVEFFEFRHLTFQEFLTARAMVEGWHRNRVETDSLVDALTPHLYDIEWREVIPLAAVLGGKASEALITKLTEEVRYLDASVSYVESPTLDTLGRCLADEAAARPGTIRAAIQQLVRFGGMLEMWDFIAELARGRYGREFRDIALTSYVSAAADLHNTSLAVLAILRAQNPNIENGITSKPAEIYSQYLLKPEPIVRCEGAMGLVGVIFNQDISSPGLRELLSTIRDPLISMLFSDSAAEKHAAAWLLGLLGSNKVVALPILPDALGRLFLTWRTSTDEESRETAAWAIAQQPIVSRDVFKYCSSITVDEVHEVLKEYESLKEEGNAPEKTAALVIAWYRKALDNTRLTNLVQQLLNWHKPTGRVDTLKELLDYLGK